MKAAILKGPRKVVVEQREVPSLRTSEILVRMQVCGLCGTDLEKYRGDFLTPPMLGHEVCGIIEATGDGVEGYRRGDRVFVHHHVPCHACYYCRRGDFTMCDSFQETNLDPCGLAEFFRVPEANVRAGAIIKLRDNVSFEEGAFIEPIACCIRGLRKLRFKPGDDVIVVGCGPAGLTFIQLLKLRGASRIIATDIIPLRLQAAQAMGASSVLDASETNSEESVLKQTGGRGVDFAILATSSTKAAVVALNVLRKGGQMLLFGSPHRGDKLEYDLSQIFIREISIVPSYSTSEVETRIASKLIEGRRINPLSMVTHRFPLPSVGEALTVLDESKSCLNVLVAA